MRKLFRAVLGGLWPSPLDPEAEQRVAHAVALVDPRLRAFANYPKAYLAAVEQARDYIAVIAEMLPEPLPFCVGNYASDPLLHTLFTEVSAMADTVKESREIGLFCRNQPLPQEGELFALMGMRRHSKQVLGSSLHEGVLQADVSQRLIYFTDHTLMFPALERQTFMDGLQHHLCDSLWRSLADEIAEGLSEQRALETERDILSSRLRSAITLQDGSGERLVALRHALQPFYEKYSLAAYHKLFDEFMADPQRRLRLEQCEMPIDMRGVMREGDERLSGRFRFYDLVSRDRRRWTILPVRLPLAEWQPVLSGYTKGQRWMAI